jgi:uncharacterized membrane protein (UPF0127 family)
MTMIDWIRRVTSKRPAPHAEALLNLRNVTRDVALAQYVDVADHGAKRRRGLLGQTMLPPGHGLWIIPCEAVHTFGMKFSIDLIYLDRNRRVRKVRTSVKPGRISGCWSAHSVLELASGTVLRSKTQVGDKVELFTPSMNPA